MFSRCSTTTNVNVKVLSGEVLIASTGASNRIILVSYSLWTIYVEESEDYTSTVAEGSKTSVEVAWL